MPPDIQATTARLAAAYSAAYPDAPAFDPWKQGMDLIQAANLEMEKKKAESTTAKSSLGKAVNRHKMPLQNISLPPMRQVLKSKGPVEP